MPRLLIVHHSPTDTVRSLTDRVVSGANDDAMEGVEVVVMSALDANAEDVLSADGYLLGTTANFGYMSGALKHFFDTVYYPSLDHVAARPYGLWVHGNNDTVGAAAAVEKLASGLELTKGAATLEVTGAVTSAMREQAYELGGTLAALLMD